PEWAFRVLLPLGVFGLFLAVWHAGIAYFRATSSASSVLPTPWEVVLGIAELARKGLLLKYTVSSLFRVTWAFLAAVLLGVPLGLVMGWFARTYQALNPLVQIMRPISPIAWIPLSIAWFGI